VVFELSQSNKPNTNKSEKQLIYFNFTSITLANILTTIKNNPHLIILITVSMILGGLIAWAIDSLSFKKNVKSAEGKFLKLLNKKEKFKKMDEKIESNDKKMTLREKFEKAGLKLNDTKEEDKPKEKKKEEVISKDEFLKEFKKEDPDDNKGKEPKVEKKEEPKKREPFTLLGKIKKD